MIYVLDTSAFIVLKNFYPAAFPSLWARLESLVQEGTLSSVLEVLNELNNYNDTDLVQDWARQHRGVFTRPSNEELLIVQQILTIPHFQTIVSARAILKGTPVADPFVIAAAKAKGGTVVTQEKFRPNAAKIPNVCVYFAVPYVDLEGFMEQQGWTF